MSVRRVLRKASALDIVPIAPNEYLLRSDFVNTRVSGESARDIVENLLQAATHATTAETLLSSMDRFPADQVRATIDRLVEQGALVVSTVHDPTPAGLFFDEFGLGAEKVALALGECRIGIFGLRAQGAHLALELARLGVRQFQLFDPFPYAVSSRTLLPDSLARWPGAGGQRRADEVLNAFLSKEFGVDASAPASDELTRDSVTEAAAQCDLLVGCLSEVFPAGQHFVNHAAIAHGVPALFSHLGAADISLGPLVIPGETACFMCSRMRKLATSQEFELEMSYEEFRDAWRTFSDECRPHFPFLASQLGGEMAFEVLRILVQGLGPPQLAGRIMTFRALEASRNESTILWRADCPSCKKKRSQTRNLLRLSALLADDGPTGDILSAASVLVDAEYGLFQGNSAIRKDPSEPALPYVWRTVISNHVFLSERQTDVELCSGKGMTLDEARSSSLGEGVERYSSSVAYPEDFHEARRLDLEGKALAFEDLVLYRHEQYASVPYCQPDEKQSIRWTKAQSLTTHEQIWVPSIAVFLTYTARPQEFIFQATSNGLATGPTRASAVLRAAYEVLERDALLIAWMNRLPGQPYRVDTHPSEDVRRVERDYANRGTHLRLVRLPSDHRVAVFAAMIFDQSSDAEVAAVVGLGVDLEPTEAARRAVLEVAQVRPSLKQRARREGHERIMLLKDNPLAVQSLEDHALLYCHPKFLSEFDFLCSGQQLNFEKSAKRMDDREALMQLIDALREVKLDLLYVDLTPSELRPLGLYTARAIIPSALPIWFGHQSRRLGGGRLFEVPAKLGHKAPREPGDFNPMPHPIA